MKKLFVLTFFLACKVLTGCAQNATFAAGNSAEKEIRQTEMRRFEMMVHKDIKGLREVLADDLTYTHSNGLLDGKEQFLAALEAGKTLYQSIQSEEIKVRLLGEMAVLNGVAAVKVFTNGQTNEFRIRYTDIYAKRDGRWQLIAWQSTRLPQP